MNFNKKYFKNKKLQSNTQISLQENNQFNLLRKNNNLVKLLCSILIGCNIKDIINIINIKFAKKPRTEPEDLIMAPRDFVTKVFALSDI